MTSSAQQTLVSAEGGVTFRFSNDVYNLAPVIKGYLEMQASTDVAESVVVPDGWGTAKYLNQLCGCTAPGVSSSGDRLLGVMVG